MNIARRQVFGLLAGAVATCASWWPQKAKALEGPNFRTAMPRTADSEVMLAGTVIITREEYELGRYADDLVRQKAENLARSLEDAIQEQITLKGWRRA